MKFLTWCSRLWMDTKYAYFRMVKREVERPIPCRVAVKDRQVNFHYFSPLSLASPALIS